jgi:hypothetical protein
MPYCQFARTLNQRIADIRHRGSFHLILPTAHDILSLAEIVKWEQINLGADG